MLALFGVVLGFAAIIFGNSLEGGQFAALLNVPAFVIVVGGTLGAIVLQTPIARLTRAMHLLVWVVRPPNARTQQQIQTLTEWSRIARRDGFLGLENIAAKTSDPFQKKGLELIVDGVEANAIRRLLEAESRTRIDFDLAAAQVYRSMGGYAPTIGILGAVIGLIQVMGNLADPEQLGEGIATAFVATIYGVGFANLLFLPVADRIRSIIVSQAGYDDLLIEGLIAIADGEHPRNIELRLNGLVDPCLG